LQKATRMRGKVILSSYRTRNRRWRSCCPRRTASIGLNKRSDPIETGGIRSGALWPRMQEHPGRPELVSEHRKPGGEKRLLHRHENLTAIRQQAEYAVGFLVAVER